MISVSVSHFGWPNWEALCKAYDFHEGMHATMDLGDPDIKEDNMDIWILVDTLPIVLLCECSDQTSNSLISVLKCHPWISNADTTQYLKDL